MLLQVFLLLTSAPMFLAQESDTSLCSDVYLTQEASAAAEHVNSYLECVKITLIQYGTELLRNNSNRRGATEAYHKCIRPPNLDAVNQLVLKTYQALIDITKYDRNFAAVTGFCFSLRELPLQSCVDAKARILEQIKEVSEDKSLPTLYTNARKAWKESYKECFEGYVGYREN